MEQVREGEREGGREELSSSILSHERYLDRFAISCVHLNLVLSTISGPNRCFSLIGLKFYEELRLCSSLRR